MIGKLPEGGFKGPVKRSVTIAGHQTSISLEPLFWRALDKAAQDRRLPLNALIATIDHARIGGEDPVNLASALRTWILLNHCASNGSEDSAAGSNS